ncbi:hypothetical protein PAMP_013799 [Pampus punctatissimus]
MAASQKKLFEIFVSKIPWTLARKEMKQYFGQFGQLKKCYFPFDTETGFHKGYCWIRFVTEEGLNNALEKDNHVVEGTELLVGKKRKRFDLHSLNKDGEHD